MKALLTTLSPLLVSSAIIAQQLPTELQTPEVVSVNRMPMRALAFAFESRSLASKREKEKSVYFLTYSSSSIKSYSSSF